ncbi:MAG: hypothetical protein FWC21_06795 [Treponema sp.]|nr:hypothetical protein [Treponema sp.]
MSGMPFILLIYSAFTVNLVLQCGIGLRGIAESKGEFFISSFIKLGLIFISIIFLWFLFSKALSAIIQGLLLYVLLFPVSAILYDGLEFIIFRYIFKRDAKDESLINFPGGITAVSVFICVNAANSFLETAILSFGFISGIFLVNIITREVRKRAALEAVPVFLQGKPLILITMGILSMVFSTASILLFRMINAQ